MMFLLPALPQLLLSLFSLPLPYSPKCLTYVFHLPRVGSMGMQWAQKLISDWCLRVLIWTSWCSHALNVNKAHAFGWACGVLWALFSGDQPAAQAQVWPLQTTSEILRRLTARYSQTVLKISLTDRTCNKSHWEHRWATCNCTHAWKLWNLLWIFREGAVGKFGGDGQAFRWPTGIHFWPPLWPLFTERNGV